MSQHLLPRRAALAGFGTLALAHRLRAQGVARPDIVVAVQENPDLQTQPILVANPVRHHWHT